MSDGISYAPLTPELAPQWLYYLRSLNGLVQHDYCGWQSINDYLRCWIAGLCKTSSCRCPYANVRVMTLGWGRGRPRRQPTTPHAYESARGMDGRGDRAFRPGMDYVSQCFAGTDELVEVIAASAADLGVFVTHVRYKRGTLAGVREAVEIGRRAGVPVHISHLKGTSATRGSVSLLAYVDNTGRARGRLLV